MALYVIYRALHHVTVSDRVNLVDPHAECAIVASFPGVSVLGKSPVPSRITPPASHHNYYQVRPYHACFSSPPVPNLCAVLAYYLLFSGRPHTILGAICSGDECN